MLHVDTLRALLARIFSCRWPRGGGHTHDSYWQSGRRVNQ